MTLFEKAGEKFEEAKQKVTKDNQVEYVCRSCEEPLDKDYEFCPNCGEPTVEPVE